MISSYSKKSKNATYLALIFGAAFIGLTHPCYSMTIEDSDLGSSLVRSNRSTGSQITPERRLYILSALAESASSLPHLSSGSANERIEELSSSTRFLLNRLENQGSVIITHSGTSSLAGSYISQEGPRVLTDFEQGRQLEKMNELFQDFFNGDLTLHAQRFAQQYRDRKRASRGQRKKFDTYGSDLDPLLGILLSEIIHASREEEGKRPVRTRISEELLDVWGEALGDLRTEVDMLSSIDGDDSDHEELGSVIGSLRGFSGLRDSQIDDEDEDLTPSLSLRGSRGVLEAMAEGIDLEKLDEIISVLAKKSEEGSEETSNDEQDEPNQLLLEQKMDDEDSLVLEPQPIKVTIEEVALPKKVEQQEEAAPQKRERPSDNAVGEIIEPKRQRIEPISQEIPMTSAENIIASLQTKELLPSGRVQSTELQNYIGRKSLKKYEKFLRKYNKKNVRKAARRAKTLKKIERRMQKKYNRILKKYTKKGVLNKGKLRKLIGVSFLRDSIIKLLDENK